MSTVLVVIAHVLTKGLARERRQQERHQWAALLDRAKLDHQNLVNRQLPGGEAFVEKAIQRSTAAEKAAA